MLTASFNYHSFMINPHLGKHFETQQSRAVPGGLLLLSEELHTGFGGFDELGQERGLQRIDCIDFLSYPHFSIYNYSEEYMPYF